MDNSTKHADKLVVQMNFAFLLSGLILFVSGLYANRHGLIDDAYITFQYARNLADGYGFAYHPGGEPTEGFTNLLWVVLLAPSFIFNIDPLSYARGFSVVLVLISSYFLYATYKLVVPSENFRLTWSLPVLLWLGYYNTTYHLMLGLETTLYSTFLIVIVYQFTKTILILQNVDLNGISFISITDRQRVLRYSLLTFFVIGVLTGLTRPEGFAVTFVLGLCFFLLRVHVKTVAATFLLYLFSIFVIVIIKYWVFKGFTPNSYYLKVLGADSFLPGFDFIISFIDEMKLWFVLGALLFIKTSLKKETKIVIYSLLILLLLIILFYFKTVPMMAWEHRYLTPYVFILVLFVSYFISLGINEFLKCYGEKTAQLMSSYFLIGLIVISLLGFESFKMLSTAMKGVMNKPEPERLATFDLHYREKELGYRLAELDLSDELSIAFWDAGLIPYLSKSYFIDLHGLNNNTIARLSSGEGIIYYTLNKSPDIIIFASRDAEKNVNSIKHNLFRSAGLIGRSINEFFIASLQSGYVYNSTFMTPYYDLNFFINKKSKNYALLDQQLPELLSN
jgi:hypothetical protein